MPHHQPYTSILQAIGNTPLVQLNQVIDDPTSCADIWVKCEFMNPTGSIKDRMALHIIEQAEKAGDLKPGGTIVENTSGNTGLSLAMIAAVKGYQAIFTLPDKMSKEKIDMIKSFGAKVVITPTDVPGDSPEHYVQTAKRLAKEIPDAYYVDQYHSPYNIDAHFHSTAQEIWQQTGGDFDYFVAGTGTGGTISGVGRFLKQKNSTIKTVGIDPYGSIHYHYFYTQNLVTPHVYKVEGIGEDILCKALDFSVVDEMIQTDDACAFHMARRLIREEGLFCGGSSGAIVHGAIELAKRVGAGKKIITVLTDSASRYISKFLSDAWMEDHGFISSSGNHNTVSHILRSRTPQQVIMVKPDEKVSILAEHMRKTGVSQLPVTDKSGKPFAIVHETDLLKALQSGKISFDAQARDIANPIKGLATPDTNLDELYKIFAADEVAIIVDQQKVIGIISKIDVIDYLMQAGTSR